jgi:hypothetical protein
MRVYILHYQSQVKLVQESGADAMRLVLLAFAVATLLAGDHMLRDFRPAFINIA